jgi:uncharacterized protein
LNRRSFVTQLTLSALAIPFVSACSSARSQPFRRRLLCFTKASGWEHDVVKTGPGGAPSVVDRAVSELAYQTGFEVVCTRDGRVFTEEGLADFDAFFFYTSGDLTVPGTDGHPPMPPGGKSALLAAVRGGKGFVGVHSASDTFHSEPDPSQRENWGRLEQMVVDPFIEMLGGEFLSHGPEQTATLRIVDPSFPGMQAVGSGSLERFGEWYSLVNINPQMRALAVLETEGLEGREYRRPPFPVIWARRYGSGRVYYTALGHLEAEWADPDFLGSLAGSIRWAFGDVPADVGTNVHEVAPGFGQLPPMV